MVLVIRLVHKVQTFAVEQTSFTILLGRFLRLQKADMAAGLRIKPMDQTVNAGTGDERPVQIRTFMRGQAKADAAEMHSPHRDRQ